VLGASTSKEIVQNVHLPGRRGTVKIGELFAVDDPLGATYDATSGLPISRVQLKLPFTTTG